MPEMDVWLDFACPWSYIAHHQIAGAGGDGVSTRAFQLNPDFPVEGIARPTYRVNKFGSQEESDRRDHRVVEAARQVGLEIDFSRIAMTPNTRAAHRALKAAQAQGVSAPDVVALTEAIFAAYFCDAADIGDTAVLIAVAADVGIKLSLSDLQPGSQFDAAIDADITDAATAGLRGVPHFANSETHQPVSPEVAMARLTAG